MAPVHATDFTSHPSQTNLDRYSDREEYYLGNFSRESCRDGLVNSNLPGSLKTEVTRREQLSSQPIAQNIHNLGPRESVTSGGLVVQN